MSDQQAPYNTAAMMPTSADCFLRLGHTQLVHISSYLNHQELQNLALSSRDMFVAVKSLSPYAPDPLPSTSTARVTRGTLTLHTKHILYSKYQEAAETARSNDLWLTEVLCLRLPADILEHHILPAFILSFPERSITVESSGHIISLRDHRSGRTYYERDMTRGLSDSLTPMLQSLVQTQIIDKFVAAGSSPALAAKLWAKNKSVEGCLLPAVGKAMMRHCIVSVPALFKAVPHPDRDIVPSALRESAKLIGNLNLTLEIDHQRSKAWFCFPSSILDVHEGVKKILTSFPVLKTLRVTVTEKQNRNGVEYTLQRPTIKTYSQMYLPGGVSEENMSFKEIMLDLAKSISKIKGLVETSVLGVQVETDWKDGLVVQTLWVDGVEQDVGDDV